jgi:LCP family protein required for cell wall assembly
MKNNMNRGRRRPGKAAKTGKIPALQIVDDFVDDPTANDDLTQSQGIQPEEPATVAPKSLWEHSEANSGGTPDARLQAALGTTLSPYAAAYYNGSIAAEKPKKKREIHYKKIFKRAAITLVILLLLAAGFVGYKAIKASHIFGGNILGLLNPTTLKGEDTGRVNILLAGYSADDPGHSGGELTDSIMILSIDVKNNTAFMLSIPRDMWVAIPGHGHQKINSVYEFGESDKFSASGLPSGGMGLLEQTIQQDFAININYYGLIDYAAMRDAANAVGGVSVDIESPDPRGLYDPNISAADKGPLKLANGVQTLNGQTALNLARARGDSYYSYGFPQSDFDRTMHQRQLLLALKSKAVSAGTLSNPFKISGLLDSLGNNVKTDFNSNEAGRLYQIMKKVPNASIKSLSLNDLNKINYLKSYTSNSGQSALIPRTGLDNFTEIQGVLDNLLVVPTPAAK